MTVSEFIDAWKASGASERANKDSFLRDLCDVLGVPRPDPKTGDSERDRYVFEREAVLLHASGKQTLGFIDLYKHDTFILEAKQGSEAQSKKIGTARRNTPAWNIAMQEAFGQALTYSQTVEPPPPFIVITDIGYCFDLYASFDGTRNYRKFPDALTSRIYLEKLTDPQHLDTLRQIFLDPHSLDPSKRAAKVTREIAGYIAHLARALEQAGHEPEVVAKFLMRCLFTMYAEDVELLPKGIFSDEIEKWADRPESFRDQAQELWKRMNEGGDLYGRGHIWQFNGGLFADQTALPLTRQQILWLGLAAKSYWKDVEPAIFGTLLERALDPKERHRLGAHYTPRAYVERLVRPTIEEPVRAEWDSVQAAVQSLIASVDPKKNIKAVAVARRLVYAFYDRLTRIRVLDPACGSGNFLFVALDLFKRIENEVLDLLDKLGETRALYGTGRTVTPEQFLGIEIKPWAKEITELVLWIGYLQWQIRTRGWKSHPQEPILRDYHNIELRDAVLAYDSVEPLLDDEGKPVTRWDGETVKTHPVTGEDVPEDTARTAFYRYVSPRKAEWPEAEFIVGNPPFVGNKRMRTVLGDGYVQALRDAHADVPETADYVMYWWNHAARTVRAGKATRFGLITTNSVTQVFNRKILQTHLNAADPISIVFAIADHPWVDSADGAAVRVAMTVGQLRFVLGTLLTVSEESDNDEDATSVTLLEERGRILADLRVGAGTANVTPLAANRNLSFMGVILVGQGFVVDVDDPIVREEPDALKPYIVGSELNQNRKGRFVIDFFGLALDEVRRRFPLALQRVINTVKPGRDQVKRQEHRSSWWLFGEKRPAMRKALEGLDHFIAVCRTAKHRVFQMIEKHVLVESTIIAIAIDDPCVLGVLSSRPHVVFSLAVGSVLEDRPRYNNTLCFDPFPFPELSEYTKHRICGLGKQLEAHRERQQELHPDLTITGVYNALEKLRSGQPLTEKEKEIHEQGLVSVLKQIHDELDGAVFDAYGWPHDLTDEQILERLVALNAERAEEEKHGIIRWLRPEFQNPAGTRQPSQAGLPSPLPAAGDEDQAASGIRGEGSGVRGKPAAATRPWPEELPQQVAAVRDLVSNNSDITAQAVTKSFTGARLKDIERVLESLAALGLAISVETAHGRLWRAGSGASQTSS